MPSPVLGTGARTQMRYIEETDPGVTPTVGVTKNLRRTDDSLGFKTSAIASNEIRSDRQTTDTILVSASVEGGLNFEMSYGEYDAFLEACLWGDWVVNGGAAFDGTATTSTITADSAPTGTSAFTTLALGQWVRLQMANTASPNHNRLVQVSTTVAPTATVLTLEGTPLASGAVTGMSLSSSRLTNGVHDRSYTLEREHADLGVFLAFRGCRLSKMSLSMESGAIVNGVFDFMGNDQVISEAGSTLPGVPQESLAFDIMNAVQGVGDITEGGVPLVGTYIKSCSMSFDNKLRGRDAIGYLGFVSVGAGTMEVSADLSVYFSNTDLYKKFINSTRTSFRFRLTDAQGYGYIFTFPSGKFTEAGISAGGKEADSMVSMKFGALMDPVTRKTIYIDRVGPAT